MTRTWQAGGLRKARPWKCLVCIVSMAAVVLGPVTLLGPVGPAGAGTMVSPVGFWKCEAYIADWGPTYPADKAPGGPFLNATTITSFDPATGTYSGIDIAWGIGRETVTGTFNSNNDTQTWTTVGPHAVVHGHAKVTVNPDGTITTSGTWDNSIGQSGTVGCLMKDFVLSGTVEAASCGTEETSCPVPPVPAPGVEIDATGPEDASVSTGEDGVYTMYLEPGAYTVTPGMGDFTFDPSSRPVDLSHGAGEADFTLLGFPDGIDWKMPDRVELGTKVSPDGELPPASYVYPRVWSAELYLTEDGKRVTSCPAGFTWEWDVTPLHTSGNGEPTVTQPEDGCSTSFTTTQLGTYRVAAQLYQQTGEGLAKAGPGVDTPDVVLNDLLIVGLGDSNGSGEGDPPFYFDQCHRGTASYQYQAAQMLEEQFDGHTSITFVSASCSGAKIQNLTSLPYSGFLQPFLPTPLGPQVSAVRALIADSGGQPPRRVAAAFVSVGVNNLAFGPLMTYCVLNAIPKLTKANTCANQDVTPVYTAGFISGFKYAPVSSKARPLRQWVADLTAGLPGLYSALDPVLADLVAPEETFVTEYPTFGYADTKGDVCSMTRFSSSGGRIFTQATWEWLMDVNMALNAQVDATSTLGWHVVRVNPDYFLGHGYCSSDSWFVRFISAVWQENKAGAFHPTKVGAAVTAKLVANASCPVLAGEDECKDMPLPDNPRASSNP